MKVLIIYRVDISKPFNAGVYEKMKGQTKGFLDNGHSVDNIYLNEKGLYFNDREVEEIISIGWLRDVYKINSFYNSIWNYICDNDYELILIRHHLVIPSLLKFLSNVQAEMKSCKVILDLPTYPYHNEWGGLKGRILLRIDEKLKHKLAGSITAITHYGLEKELWGIKCINITNGIIPLNNVYLRKYTSGSDLHLIAVGKWRDWHGLEHLIKGIKEYYNGRNARKVFLDIVGSGSEIETYKSLVVENKLEDYIIFHGSKTGIELDTLLERANIGIGTLAIHKKKVLIDSSLKHRLYCNNNLPFILTNKDLDFPSNLNFVKYYQKDKVVDIEELLSFHDELCSNENINTLMREHTLEHLGWNKKVKYVLKELNLQSDT